MSRTIRGALVWSFAERYAGLVISIAGTMLLSRLLTPAQVGVYSLCAAVTTVATILRDFGVTEYLIQEKELDRDKQEAAFGVALVIGWTIGLLVLLMRDLVADFYREPGLSRILTVLALNFFVLPFGSPVSALLTRELAFRKLFLIQFVSNLVQTTSAVLLAWLGYGYMSLAWSSVIGIVCQIVLLARYRPGDFWMWPNFRSARKVLSYGSMFVMARVVETVSRNSHEFIIGKRYGFAWVGQFSRAFGLIELFYSNVAAAAIKVATPMFAADNREGEDLAKRYAHATTLLTVLAWPFFAFVALMSKEVIDVVFGAQWHDAAPIATYLAIAVMPAYLTMLGPNLLAATGRIRLRMKLSLISAPVHMLVMLAASPFGPVAMARAFCLSGLTGVLMYAWYLPRVLGCSAGALFGPSARSAWVTLIVITVQVTSAFGCRASGCTEIVSLVLTAVAALLAWLLALRWTGHPVFGEILRLWQSLKSRFFS